MEREAYEFYLQNDKEDVKSFCILIVALIKEDGYQETEIQLRNISSSNREFKFNINGDCTQAVNDFMIYSLRNSNYLRGNPVHPLGLKEFSSMLIQYIL